MSGSGGVSIARSAIRGENRFYNPPPMRRMQQQLREKQQRQEEEEEEEEEDKELSSASMPPPRLKKKAQARSKNRAVVSGSEVSVGSSESSGSGRGRSEGSNLDRFLEHTTPLVHPLRSRCESECRTYFVLEDLWESFAEWSAYGAGVPLHMHGTDSTVQYYVPYLSGIQLYVLVDPSKKERNPVEDNDEISEGSSSSSKLDKLPKPVENDAVDLSVSELNRVSLGDQSGTCSLSSGETEISSNPHGRLLFEYLEYEPPFAREPLANKVSDLASRFPELMTYRSCDLSPSSWVSVSWYPIYRIPVGPTLQNLDACFLTFHSLSTPPPPQSSMGCSDTKQSVKVVPLPTFGLASYKLKLSVWNQNRAQESQKLSSLQQAADKWLKRLQVDHPDYMFFTSNGHK